MNEATGRVFAEQGPLWALKHFDPLEIEGAEYLALQRGYIGIVVINRYRALENVVKIILCDAPDRLLLALAGSCVGHEHARRQPDEIGAGDRTSTRLHSSH